jgi:hypothetical protein
MRRAHFENLDAWLTAAETPGPAGRSESSRDNSASERWDFSAGFAGAVALARQGWPEGLARVDAIRAEVSQHVMRELCRPGWAFDVAGAVPDVGRYLAGEPENMLAPAEEPAPARVVRLVVNVAASCNVDAKVLFARGAAACALVDAFEATGCRVEVVAVVAVAGHSNGKDCTADSVTLKLADQPADRDRLAFALCHPGFMRRLWFAVAESTYNDNDWQFYALSRCYGYPADPPASERGDVYLPAAKGWEDAWSTPEKAAAWILKQLQAQGIEIMHPNQNEKAAA